MNSNWKSATSAFAFFTGCLSGVQAAAQTSTESPAMLDSSQPLTSTENPEDSGRDAIVVTARKRAGSETVQATPITISAFGGEQMKQANVFDVMDIGKLVPGVSFQPSTYKGAQAFSIRGMANNSSAAADEPTVGIIRDGIYVGVSVGAISELFDVASVQVLRGPQGTLLGRNVTGGAILVDSRTPTWDDTIDLSASFGNGQSLRGSVIVNSPVVEDKIAARIAVMGRTTAGYYHNIYNSKPFGASDVLIVRPSLLFKASPDLNFTVIGEYYSDKGHPVAVRQVVPSTVPNAPITQAEQLGYVTPADPYDVNLNETGFNELVVKSITARADLDTGPGVLTFVSGYRDMLTDTLLDTEGSPFDIWAARTRQAQEQYSAELRYAAKLSDWVSITIGAFYFHQSWDIRTRRTLDFQTVDSAGDSKLLGQNGYAAFAEVDVTILPQLTLTLGGRYTKEDKKFLLAGLGNCSLDFTTCTYQAPSSFSDNNFSPKAGLSYQLDRDHLLYGSVTRGYRSGGFSLRGATLIEPYASEQVTAYEIGSKNEFLDRRLTLNVAGYVNKYEDLQRNVLSSSPSAGLIQSIFNAAAATIKGVEIEATARITPDFTISGVYGYVHARYDAYLGRTDLNTLRFARVPATTGNVRFSYTPELANGGRLGFQAGATYTGSYYSDEFNTFPGQNSYILVDGTVSYTLPHRDVTVSLYGANILDKGYYSFRANLGGRGQNEFIGTPRQWGLRIEASF